MHTAALSVIKVVLEYCKDNKEQDVEACCRHHQVRAFLNFPQWSMHRQALSTLLYILKKVG
jgi:hypothetical protein